MFDLYLITDADAPGGVVEATRTALSGLPPERVAVQLRDKAASTGELVRVAKALREVTAARSALLLINDRADVAILAGADGVHLPENGMSPDQARQLLGRRALIGVSRHDAAGVAAASRDGASFAVLGPWAAVPGKNEPLGAEAFAKASRAGIPVLALGGVTPALTGAVLRAGARGVAVMRGVYRAPDPAAAALAYLRSLDSARAAVGWEGQ